MKPVEVFNKEDFESPVFPTPQERADYCNKLLSERLITYYGNEDSEGFMYLGTEQEEGDNFVMIGFKQTIPKEPVKKEITIEALDQILKDAVNQNHCFASNTAHYIRNRILELP